MANKVSKLASIPPLGSGIGFRMELADQILEAKEAIDFIEIVADQFFEIKSTLKKLEQLKASFTIIPHGIGLSIGSVDPPKKEYLKKVKEVIDITGSPYYSEHLAMTKVPGIDIGHLSPLRYTEETLKYVIENVTQVQNQLNVPMILENVTYLFPIPKSEMNQATFFRRLVEATDCGILLDVTNVYTNAKNHGFDPVVFLEEMPLDRVVQTHIAGGYWDNDMIIDSHSEVVDEGSWALLQTLCNKVSIKGCILEHDGNFPKNPNILLDQIKRARAIINR